MCFRSKLQILLAIQLVATRMICAKLAHHARFASLLGNSWIVTLLIIQSKINRCIGVRANWRMLSILPLSANRDYLLTRLPYL
jgi:hypothetical protein